MNAVITFSNALTVAEDGWAMLAPFGEFAGVALTSEGPRAAVQVVDKETGAALVNSVKNFAGKARRFFRSVPIFNGHPDVPGMSDRWPDAAPKGHIGDLQVREDGIYVLPVFNEAGAEILNSGTRVGFSAYVEAAVVGERDGKLLARWTHLKSAGLTDTPNLPVELLNEQLPAGAENTNTMNPLVISAALAAIGVRLANATPTETDVVAAITAADTERRKAVDLANAKDAEITALKVERDGLKAKLDAQATEIANSATAARKALIDARVADGAITEAERALWDGRLKTDFANESVALGGLKGKALKTTSQVANSGDRRQTAADPGTAEGFADVFKSQFANDAKLSKSQALDRAVAVAPEAYAAWRAAGGQPGLN